jgi:parallel beta-helix repeat protein
VKRIILLTVMLLTCAVHSSPAQDTTPPDPDPMTWAMEPKVTGLHSIKMKATTATDPSGVEYYFNNVTNPAHDSDWQDSPIYEDTGLNEKTWYTYQVKARDKSPSQNETGYSDQATERTAATWGVPWPSFTRIQYAIDSSLCRDGDIILVRSGHTQPIEYTEEGNHDVDFKGKAITVRSTAGPGLTIINSSGSPTEPHRAFIFQTGEDANSVVSGFTITGGYVEGGYWEFEHGAAIYCDGASPTITDCIIRENEAYDPGGWTTYGGAIECVFGAAPTITDCNIFGNWASRGGAIDCYSSSPTIRNCIIASNEAIEAGGGIYLEEGSSPIIEDCIIGGNVARVGGGIICFEQASPTITNCLIAGNEASYYGGGGIDCTASSPIVTNCTINSNFAGGAEQYGRLTGGGGVNCEPNMMDLTPSLPIITNCIFQDNIKHAIYEYDPSCDPNVSYCLFDNNPDGDYWDENIDSLTGANSINNIADGLAHDNIDGDPCFVMNGPNGVTGTWTPSATYPEYDPETNRTTLLDTYGSFTPGQLKGKMINPNTNQRRHSFITDNTVITIEVVGDATWYVSYDGDPYEIIDYHLQNNSPCIDTGTMEFAPSADIEGFPRPVDIPGVPNIEAIADLNDDNDVDFEDVAILITYWLNDNCIPPEVCEGADIAPPEPDGVVDFLDYAAMALAIFEKTIIDIGAYEFQM